MQTKLARVMILVALALATTSAIAGPYPERAVRIVVGLPAGSLPDTIARALGQKLAEALGTPVVVENVTGAAGNIAADHVAKARADGYTLGVLSQTQVVVNPNLYKLPYDPVEDFAPITLLTLSPNVLVVPPDFPARTIPELVALAKHNPGGLTFASGGTGSGTHLAAELLKSAAGIDLRHIPYKGVSAAIPDLLTGRVSLMFSPIQSVLPLLRDGRLRAVAVTSRSRSPVLPDVPTVAEAGYAGFEATLWNGLFAPAGTPPAIVSRLHREAVKALASPQLHARFEQLGMETAGSSPDAFGAAIRAEIPSWGRVIKAAGITRD
jgi:tripartite-type tricarboxylate transporter receptor subunit TctC